MHAVYTFILTAMLSLGMAMPQALATDENPYVDPVTGDFRVVQSEYVEIFTKDVTCLACVQAVEAALKQTDKVKTVKGDLDRARIHVVFKEGMRLSDDEIMTLVREAGYTPISMTRGRL